MRFGVSCLLVALAFSANADGLRQDWNDAPDRTWVGQDFWANRLQDWRVADGRLECVETREKKPLRAAHLLTASLDGSKGKFDASVHVGVLPGEGEASAEAMAGFLVGAGAGLDYRAAAFIHHSPGNKGGLIACITSAGVLQLRDMTAKGFPVLAESDDRIEFGADGVELRLAGNKSWGKYTVRLTALDLASAKELGTIETQVDPAALEGSFALLSHPGKGKGKTRGFWFDDLFVEGGKVVEHGDRTCGPVLSTMYTLSRGVLKLSAQMMPLGNEDPSTVTLEEKVGGEWKPIATAEWDTPAYVALFKVEGWDGTKDHVCRVSYEGDTYDVLVRKDPVAKQAITLAGYSCVQQVRRGLESGNYDWEDGMWFPHTSVIEHSRSRSPDLLFFSGDQIYEGIPTSVDNDHLNLDYLYKWYMFCWTFRDLTWDMPTVCVPDDHDVYHGNLWGHGGRAAKKPSLGGYTKPAEFVKMVERTQTANLPDPFDPTPVEQGIGVYYTGLDYGGISYAILEDRKFKTGEKSEEALAGDPANIHLLGQRQLDFLEHWAADWAPQTEMKCVLSQTPYATLHTGWGWGERLYQFSPPSDDRDSGGWPKHGRDKALRKIRKGFGFIVAGDQHLGTLVHQGIDDFGDAAWNFCVPAVGNYYPRAWYPSENKVESFNGMPEYTGKYRDFNGNLVEMWAAANPNPVTGRKADPLSDFVPGYATIVFNKKDRTITAECWPRTARIGDDADQFEGWSKTIDQLDNYSRKPAAWLPPIEVQGFDKPVLRVVDQASGETVYALRLPGNSFQPWTFAEGKYSLEIGQPGTERLKVLKNLDACADKGAEPIKVVFD